MPTTATKVEGVDLDVSTQLPRRANYKCIGWSETSDGTVQYNENHDYVANSSTTLYAVWESATTFTVTYNSNVANDTGVSGMPSPLTDYVVSGDSVTLASKPSRTNYTFDYWNTQEDGTGQQYQAGSSFTPTANTILYAKWNLSQNANQYIVTFNANTTAEIDGDMPEDIILDSQNQSFTLPAAISRTDGVAFNGWLVNINDTGNVTAAGATVDNYYSISNNNKVGNTATIYASWNIATVVFNPNGGVGGGTFEGAPGSKQPATWASECGVTNPTRANYKFLGWSNNSSDTAASTEWINCNAGNSITFYAVWAPAYTITYNLNGGDSLGNVPNTDQKLEGIDYTITSSSPTREGYTFDGWNTSADGTGTDYSGGDTYSTDADLDLYAQWTEGGETPSVVHSIIFDLNGGSGTTPEPVSWAEGQDSVLPSTSSFFRNGKGVNYWSLNPNTTGDWSDQFRQGGNKVYFDGDIMNAITPYLDANNNFTLYAAYNPW